MAKLCSLRLQFHFLESAKNSLGKEKLSPVGKKRKSYIICHPKEIYGQVNGEEFLGFCIFLEFGNMCCEEEKLFRYFSKCFMFLVI